MKQVSRSIAAGEFRRQKCPKWETGVRRGTMERAYKAYFPCNSVCSFDGFWGLVVRSVSSGSVGNGSVTSSFGTFSGPSFRGKPFASSVLLSVVGCSGTSLYSFSEVVGSSIRFGHMV